MITGTELALNRSGRGAVSVWLLIVLGLLAIASGVFWITQCRNAIVDPSELYEPDVQYTLLCEACNAEKTMYGPEAKKIQRKDGKLQCPTCKQFAGQWGLPRELREAEKKAAEGGGMAMP